MHVAGTWKRLHRSGVISEVDMAKAVGEKGSARSITTQAKLPKKRRVSRGGGTKNEILAEAGDQPRQKQ